MNNMLEKRNANRGSWFVLMTLGAGLILMASVSANAADDAGKTPERTRVGIYNSRAVALAFYRSESWQKQVSQHMAESKKAKEAGDKKREAELQTWGDGGQDRAHRQVFGDAPIDNILATMTNSLPQIEKQAKVQKIVAKPPKDAAVEVVDVTSLMVEQFRPTPETLKLIDELKNHPPLSQDKFPIKD